MGNQNGVQPVTLADYAAACHQKKGPPPALAALRQSSELANQLYDVLHALGLLEPRSAYNPDLCNVKTVYHQVVDVPPATTRQDDAKGTVIVPRDAKLIKISAPMHQALVVDKLRCLPLNRTAAEFGSVSFKRMQVMGFSDGFCPAGEPADGNQDLGVFQNVERVILCPKSCFDLHAKNRNRCSTAKFLIHAEMWSAC